MRTFIVHAIIAFIASYAYFRYGDPMLPYNAVWAVFVGSCFMGLLWLTSPFYHRSYFHKLPKGISLAAYFIKELIIANLRVAYDILTPNYRMKPTVFALPLTVASELEITLLVGFITLTPGSLTIDISSDHRLLYIHTLYLTDDDVEAMKESIKSGFERRILELTR